MRAGMLDEIREGLRRLQIAFPLPTLPPMNALRFCCLATARLCFLGAAKKPEIAVRFHVEANARDGDVFAMPVKFRNPPRDGFVERVPSLSERDVQAIYPTNAGDGTFGCAFILNTHGRNALQTISMEKRGSSLVVFVSTKSGTHQIVELMIDKPINDGVIFVPRGMTLLEIEALQKQFPAKGQKAAKKKSA
jgi:hypothetical protein